MVGPFDVFASDSEATPSWLGEAEGLEDAQELIDDDGRERKVHVCERIGNEHPKAVCRDIAKHY